MQSDITRQVSASVYNDSLLRDKIFNFVRDPHRAVVESFGLNSTELLKHVLNARRQERNYYFWLFLPAIFLWGIIFMIISSEGRALEESALGLITFVSFLIAYIIVISKNLKQSDFIKNNLSKNSYNSNFNYEKTDNDLLNNFHNRIGGNVVFYSGFSPFVGCGLDIGGWSFAVNIDKGKKNIDSKLSPSTFEEAELYSAISQEIDDLKIQNLSVYDKIFVNGKTVRNNRDLLPKILGHPVNNVPSEYIELVMNNDIKEARFYKVIQVVDWEGDLVLSAFFRIQKNEKSLFIENNYFLLPPIGDNLKAVDRTKEHSGIRHFISWIIGLLFITIWHTLLSIVKVSEYLTEAISNLFGRLEAAQRKIVKSSPDFDYGAETSLREAVSQTYYSQHFQKLDKEKYFKIIDKRIFNLIGDFLESKNIDPSEFKERETSILNQGVIVSGGSLSGENITVGKGAKFQFGVKKGKKISNEK